MRLDTGTHWYARSFDRSGCALPTVCGDCAQNRQAESGYVEHVVSDARHDVHQSGCGRQARPMGHASRYHRHYPCLRSPSVLRRAGMDEVRHEMPASLDCRRARMGCLWGGYRTDCLSRVPVHCGSSYGQKCLREPAEREQSGVGNIHPRFQSDGDCGHELVERNELDSARVEHHVQRSRLRSRISTQHLIDKYHSQDPASIYGSWDIFGCPFLFFNTTTSQFL